MLKWITGLFKNKTPKEAEEGVILTHRYKIPIHFLTDGVVRIYSVEKGIGVQVSRARKECLNGLYIFPHTFDPIDIDIGSLFEFRVKTLV